MKEITRRKKKENLTHATMWIDTCGDVILRKMKSVTKTNTVHASDVLNSHA